MRTTQAILRAIAPHTDVKVWTLWHNLSHPKPHDICMALELEKVAFEVEYAKARTREDLGKVLSRWNSLLSKTTYNGDYKTETTGRSLVNFVMEEFEAGLENVSTFSGLKEAFYNQTYSDDPCYFTIKQLVVWRKMLPLCSSSRDRRIVCWLFTNCKAYYTDFISPPSGNYKKYLQDLYRLSQVHR